MLSKIRVEFDFDNNEPYLQLRLEGHDHDGGELADKTLKNFIEKAIEKGGMTIQYFGSGNGLPQIRIGTRSVISGNQKDYGPQIKQAGDLLKYAVEIFDKEMVSNNTVSAIKNFLDKYYE